jgi:hypothetical protein
VKRRKLSSFSLFRFGRRPLFRAPRNPALRVAGRLAGFLLRSQILTVFLGLCLLGILVGAQTRPAPGVFPHAELFDQMSVVSYRETPSDTAARFVVQLAAGGKVFRQYDVDARSFLPPPRGRSYARTITGTHYGPLRVRGHVGYGFWLDVPDSARRSLLPEQFEELYRTTLNFVKPVSHLTGVLGILSGYSVGYRIGAWNRSLSSRRVQERVLATPDLGRMIAREAWRRVLLEPVVMSGEDDATRFAAVTGTHRLYANFFRLALDDSNGFIPREAARLEALGRAHEARAMLAFAGAVQRAARDSVDLDSADFQAVERWASLLDRNGHWVRGAVPPPGEERIELFGTLAWYGLAPPGLHVDRVWVGPRMLVRVGETEGFVADEIPRTGAGCPISWRTRLREDHSGAGAMASAWLADRPEFVALAEFGRRVAAGVAGASRELAALRSREGAAPAGPAISPRPSAEARFAGRAPGIVIEPVAPDRREAYDHAFGVPGGEGRIVLLGPDSSGAVADARAARSVLEATDSTRADGRAADAMADTLRARGVRDALIRLPGVAVALGAPAAGEAWSVSLPDPRGRIPEVARLRLGPAQAYAGATAPAPAGMAEDGAAGPSPHPARVLAVAVVAPDGATATAWSGSLLDVAPVEARDRARERVGIEAVLIEAALEGPDVIWVESSLRDRFVLEEHARRLFRVEYF